MERGHSRPALEHAHAIRCCATHARPLKTERETRLWLRGRRSVRIYTNLGDSSAALLAIASPLSIAYIEEAVFGEVLWDEPIGLNACSDSIGDLVLVWQATQLVLGVSQCSTVGLPFARVLCAKKEQWTRCSWCTGFFEKIHIDQGTN